MAKLNDLEHIEVDSRQAWRNWLSQNQSRSESIWLVTYKKHTGDRYLSYDAIVEEALCFGWIDSLPRKLDADRSMLLISPRQPKSVWSKLNKERITRLIRDGLMTSAGMKKIERAKADGSWTFLDDVEALQISDDLSAALEANLAAQQNFEKFSPSVKKGILQWIKMAKRSQTRRQRIEKTVAQAALNQKAV